MLRHMINKTLRVYVNRGALVVIAAVLGIAGCQAWPESYPAGVDRVVVREKVRDARAQRIEGRPGLRVDSAAASYLDAAIAAEDLDTARRHALAFVRQAGDLTQRTAANEIMRLDEDAVMRVQRRYFPDQPGLTREALIDAYAAQSQTSAAEVKRQVEEAASLDELRRTLADVREGIEDPVKYRGKSGRILTWLPFYLPSKMAAEQVQKNGPGCPVFLGGFDQADVYQPADESGSALARHAPVFVVERGADVNYDPRVDRIGEVSAEDSDHIVVSTDRPAVYAYARRVLVSGQEHEQLVYTAWFPEHPEISEHDPMAGHIDGITVRLTLDHQSRPAIIETIANCGCFHGLYPARRLEEAAAAEFGPPAGDASYALEREAGRQLNAHIPALLDVDGADSGPTVYVAAGWHSIVHVTFAGDESDDASTVRYTLRPYTDLELLPTPGGGYTSMFYDNGLVRHAQRPEGVFFTPLGMLSAGQPRQRETQLIYWDQYDFDDPDLLSRLLNLPSSF
jgi:hypothetical protein